MHYVPGPYGPRPVLTRAEEARYAKAYSAGDLEAGKILSLSVAPLVRRLAKGYKVPPGVDRDDLVKDAHVAIMLMLRRGGFRARKSRLSTYVGRQACWSFLKTIKAHERGPSARYGPHEIVDGRQGHEEAVAAEETRERQACRVRSHWGDLPMRSRKVLFARCSGRSFTDIAADLTIFDAPVGKERARQIERDAMDFLQRKCADRCGSCVERCSCYEISDLD